MTLQEKELLTRFLQQFATAQAPQKDAEAEAMIRDAVSRQPDAAYLLVQRTLQLEQLLQASQERVKTLEAEATQPRAGASGGFLTDPNAWGSRANAAPGQNAAQRAAPAGRGAAPTGGSWGSGLFGNIAATAAGVVAGSFLFQGIQGLMNRDDPSTAASDTAAADQPLQQAEAEPELLNSYFTPEDESGDLLADGDDGGDFA
jgi:hypothetical protein